VVWYLGHGKKKRISSFLYRGGTRRRGGGKLKGSKVFAAEISKKSEGLLIIEGKGETLKAEEQLQRGKGESTRRSEH